METLEKIKKELRKEIEMFGDKIKFKHFDGKKLFAVITRKNGEKQNVYYRFENGNLITSWYYVVEEDKE